jgi:dolichyl-diphosphooligosaccharide---protein glycosyltransferase
MGDELDIRKEKIFKFLKEKKIFLSFIILAVIAWFGYYIRTKNLPLLIDATTGKYIPMALDPFVFLRYVKYILENGALMAVDTLRYYPIGYTSVSEFSFLSHAIVYLYKFLSFFNPSITIEYVHVIYPPIAFVVGLVFFFLFLRKVFDYRVALLSSAFLTVLPAYLYRTMAGFSDKEAFAMIFMFLALFAFVAMLKEKKFKRSVIYSVLAGLSVGCMWITWGGSSFVLIITGALMLLLLPFVKFKRDYLINYSIYLFCALLIFRLGYPERFSLNALMTSVTTMVLFVAWFVLLAHYLLFDLNLLKLKSKIGKVPDYVVTYLTVGVLGVLTTLVVYGFSFFTSILSSLYENLVSPFASDRWALTVAESQQPYFTSVIDNFGWTFLAVIFVGLLLLFYETFKHFEKKKAYTMTGAFGVFILLFTMSRYSVSSTIFNGTSNISILSYIGSAVLFGAYMVYVFYEMFKENAQVFKEKMRKVNIINILMFFSFLVAFVGARSGLRLLFLFAPITAIFAGYAFFRVGDYAWKLKDKGFKYGVCIVLIILAILMLNSFSQTVLVQAEYTGASYNAQWQYGMSWVRENTAEDSVFAHWWDYGYWVQAGGERATLSDGGNARGGINHFIGRHLLTGQNETEALELLAANEATHVLMISDEIGKYSAFSSIGADADYDRYSWISTFVLNEAESTETRDGYSLVYTGGTTLDDDFVYDDVLYPGGSAGVAGFIISIVTDEATGAITINEQPTAVLSYNGAYTYVPLECIFIDGTEISFVEDGEEGLDACFQILPSYISGQLNEIGAGFYLSPDVSKTVFTHLYLFGEDWDYFDLVYTDEASYPLMYYEGRIIGPMKIWEVSYPDDLNIPEEYYGTEIPDEVQQV